MIKYVKIKTGTPPEYLTKDKIYKAKSANSKECLWSIVSNDGNITFILINGCSHLNGGSWEFVNNHLYDLLNGYNKSRLSIALGKHRSYLNKLIQLGCSEELYNEIKAKITIDWSSDKPLHVNDRKHVPFTIKPTNCVLPKHKE